MSLYIYPTGESSSMDAPTGLNPSGSAAHKERSRLDIPSTMCYRPRPLAFHASMHHFLLINDVVSPLFLDRICRSFILYFDPSEVFLESAISQFEHCLRFKLIFTQPDACAWYSPKACSIGLYFSSLSTGLHFRKFVYILYSLYSGTQNRVDYICCCLCLVPDSTAPS